MNQQNDDRLMETVKELANALGLDEYEQYSIHGAGGLVLALGRTDLRDGYGYEEVTHRFTLDGTPFDPSILSIAERREWVQKLCIDLKVTQMGAAAYLDVSQSLISRDLQEIKKAKLAK